MSRQEGSHVFLRHPDGRTTVVPVHGGENLDRGLLKKLLKRILGYLEKSLKNYYKLNLVKWVHAESNCSPRINNEPAKNP